MWCGHLTFNEFDALKKCEEGIKFKQFQDFKMGDGRETKIESERNAECLK